MYDTLTKTITITFLAATLFTATAFSQIEDDNDCLSQHFYYYSNEKIFLDTILLPNKILIGFDLYTSNIEIVEFINQDTIFENIDETKIKEIYNTYYDHYYKIVIAKTKYNKTCSEIYEITNTLKTNSFILFANYTYKSGLWFGGIYYDVMSYADEFIVKVFNHNDLTDLNEVASQTNTVIKRQNEFMPDWFTLRVTKNSEYDALKMAQYFQETGKFVYSEPDFWDFIDPLAAIFESVNDTVVRIYPNPTSDIFYIEGVNVSTIRIYNYTGELVLLTDVVDNKIDISRLPKGMYSVCLFADGNKIINKSIVKK